MAKRVKKDKIKNECSEDGENKIISIRLKLILKVMKIAIYIVNFSSEEVLSINIFNMKNNHN